jgi:hypothetical protein
VQPRDLDARQLEPLDRAATEERQRHQRRCHQIDDDIVLGEIRE